MVHHSPDQDLIVVVHHRPTLGVYFPRLRSILLPEERPKHQNCIWCNMVSLLHDAAAALLPGVGGPSFSSPENNTRTEAQEITDLAKDRASSERCLPGRTRNTRSLLKTWQIASLLANPDRSSWLRIWLVRGSRLLQLGTGPIKDGILPGMFALTKDIGSRCGVPEISFRTIRS